MLSAEACGGPKLVLLLDNSLTQIYLHFFGQSSGLLHGVMLLLIIGNDTMIQCLALVQLAADDTRILRGVGAVRSYPYPISEKPYLGYLTRTSVACVC